MQSYYIFREDGAGRGNNFTLLKKKTVDLRKICRYKVVILHSKRKTDGFSAYIKVSAHR
jgi:hypothetical protein